MWKDTLTSVFAWKVVLFSHSFIVYSNYTNQIVVSVAYATLNVNYVTEIVTQDIPGLLGGIGGIIVVLMGVDLIKAFRGLWEIPYAFRHRSFRPIYETFNK